jgi:ribosomal protein L37AE/L43A
MTIEQASVPGNGSAEAVGVAMTVDPRRRLDQLSPLIHELIAWEIVHQDESGEFVLHDDVQQRLREVAALRTPSVAQVYVGRQCERCGTVGVTRLIDGARICAACSRAAKEVDAEPVIEKPAVVRRRWHRKAG